MTAALPTAVGRPRRFLAELGEQPAFGFIGPNWFASVMGTGIVANAAATLPFHLPGLLVTARGVWALDLALLALVATATVVHWLRHPDTALGHLAHPVMSHFYGAPAMALMTVGAGALLVGRPVVGTPVAVVLAAVLWSAGTGLGLWAAVAVTSRAFGGGAAPDAAFGGWLMPVVPPMVSAATGPLLLPSLPAGQARLTLVVACVAMFGLTMVASLMVVAMLWSRLVHHGVGPAGGVPTLWIVLGPVGQSITAAHNLGAASGVLLAPYADAVRAAGLVYGLPMWGFAMLWLAIAASITVRTLREGMPFSLTWWSFTFPVGTVVTGTSGLAVATGAVALAVAAGLLYAGLVLAWAVVASRTAYGVWSGRLLRAPA